MSYECLCDFDPPEWHRTSRPKAAKPHRCEECAAPIKAGERYRYDVGKWDGYIWTVHTC